MSFYAKLMSSYLGLIAVICYVAGEALLANKNA